ncbi:hypothetical protein SAY87_016021 [Trapa incisa]|uniref:18S pre-ribosomal assembly protein gar2-like protein n=1 Tax=Trapa incisa TaxID=236973 RepID=A0AAN7QXP2_9MYRT|nr:hypothetical protein SAY87_016021 [Trapa incisa]
MEVFEKHDRPQDLTNWEGSEMVSVIEGDLGGEMKMPHRDFDFFMDKKVTEFEIPKVCCKGDNDYDEIRSICVDEGKVSDEKALLGTKTDSSPETTFLLNNDAAGSLMEEKVDMDPLISNVLQVPEDDCRVDPAGKCCTEQSVDSAEKSTTDGGLQHDGSAAHGNEADQQSAKVLHDEPSTWNTKDSDLVICKVTVPENCEVKLGGNEATSVTSELPCSSQVETKTTTLIFADSASTPSDSHASLCNENKEFIENQDGHKVNEGHVSLCQYQQSHGDSSFSVLQAPVACLGNLSQRSDSSVGTSTRSFAFPVLHSEWNSSPIRMAKADRRSYRKYSGWRRGLLCCKF